jgi:hypothetical protein
LLDIVLKFPRHFFIFASMRNPQVKIVLCKWMHQCHILHWYFCMAKTWLKVYRIPDSSGFLTEALQVDG